MLKFIEESPLYRIANARSMAFFGASNSITSMGTHLLMTVLAGGFKGAIYPVHRKEEKVLELKAYRGVEDLPEVPDLAVIVLPTAVVNQTLEACGQKGIQQAVVVSGGFKEVGEKAVNWRWHSKKLSLPITCKFWVPTAWGWPTRIATSTRPLFPTMGSPVSWDWHPRAAVS